MAPLILKIEAFEDMKTLVNDKKTRKEMAKAAEISAWKQPSKWPNFIHSQQTINHNLWHFCGKA
eukprot:c17901_g1_i2 orf=752-943(-)